MRLAAILLPLTLLLRTPADAQCTATYTDGSVDDANTTFSAWTTVSDYYGQSSQCQMNWGLTFTHSYYASVGILSPSGRSATGTGYGQQTGGGGSASGFTSLAINGEEGTYYLEEDNRIECSIAGTMLLAAVVRAFFAVGRARTNYGFNTDFGGCGYRKSCGTNMNHWAGDTFTSTPANNKALGVCWNYIWKYHGFVKVGPLKRYWSITNEAGQWWVGHDLWEECDGPLP